MSDPDTPPRAATIGEIRFDADSGALEGPGGNARLAPQPSQLLAYLVRRRGEVVHRPDIAAHLWPGGKIEVDQGIAFAVREVRKGLEAVGGDPSAVETIPKRGYRLRADSPATPARLPGARRQLVVGACVLLLLVSAAVFARSATPPVLVVFEHDANSESAAALATDLGTQLTATLTATFEDRLGVIGPTGAANLAGPNDTEGARSDLGACLVLSGSARIVGPPPGRAVIFTQIVRTRDRVHVWAAQDTTSITDAVAHVLPRIVDGVRETIGDC